MISAARDLPIILGMFLGSNQAPFYTANVYPCFRQYDLTLISQRKGGLLIPVWFHPIRMKVVGQKCASW
jgi:hypothetical protein